MNKKARFGLLAGLSLTASYAAAQSSVTLYGIVDVGVDFINHVPTTAGKSGTQFSVISGGAQTSRWGLRVKEDLGGGYGTMAVLENGFDATKGTLNNAGRLFGRAAYVGLTTPLGELTLGRHPTLTYEFALAYDPVAPALFSSPAFDPAFVSRADNSVEYRKDVQVLGGTLSLNELYSFGYDSVAGIGPVAGDYRVGKEENALVNYKRGILSMGLLFDEQEGNTLATQSNKTQRFGAGTQIDLGRVKLYGAYRFLAAKASTGNQYASLYWIGAQYLPTPAFYISSDILYQDDKNTGTGNPVMASLLASYFLSKRTDVYLELATVLNKKHTNLGVNGFGTSVVGQTQTGAIVGLRTRF
jgi:predicted porin